MNLNRISVAAVLCCCWMALAGGNGWQSGGLNCGPGQILGQVWTPPNRVPQPREEQRGGENAAEDPSQTRQSGAWDRGVRANPEMPLPITGKPELFSKADLSKADLSKANLSKANLSKANLSKANLSKANLSKANPPNSDRPNSDLPNSDLPNSVRQQIGLASYQEPVTETLEPQGIPDSQRSPGETLVKQVSPWASGLPEPRELFLGPGGIQSTLRFSLLIAALSLAPAIVLMTTCYIRVIVVLSLLKQAFGAQQLPPAQVITALSLFLTFLIMAPVWQEVKTVSIDPYAAEEISWEEAWNRGIAPVRNFMARQIEAAGNERSIEVFYQYAPETASSAGPVGIPERIEEVPINLLIPAFMISELKVAFLLGFQIFLPFLVLDLVVSSVAVSMGMFMLPPHLISFPLKLILFVLVDGWSLVVGMLLQSFA